MIENAERKLLELSADVDVRAILAEEERREAGHRIILGAAHKRGRTEGLQEGRTEGLQEGRTEGRRQLLEEQLREVFGPLAEETLLRLQGASDAELGRWAKRIVKATTLADVFD